MPRRSSSDVFFPPDPPTPNTKWYLAALSVLVLVLVSAWAMGCTAGTPIVRVTHVEGAGSIDLENCIAQPDGSVTACTPSSIAFGVEAVEVSDGNEDGDLDLVHCTSITRLVLVGITFGAGTLPDPVSDARCFTEGQRRPFPWPGVDIPAQPSE